MTNLTGPMPKVWSERQPGVWFDCTYSAVLMVLVGAGFDRFPLGMYSNEERDSLESSNDLPDDGGATFTHTDVAVLNRYGVTMKRLADGSLIGLKAALSTPGRLYAVAGLNARLPTALRRWSPRFAKAHAVCCVPLGKGKVLWLDPMAPMAYPGEHVRVETVLRWAFIDSDARFLAMSEATLSASGVPKETDMGLTGHKHQIPKLVRIPSGIILRRAPAPGAPVHRQVSGFDTVQHPFEAEVLATGAWPFLLARRRGGDGGFYVSADDLPSGAWLGTALWPDEIAALVRGLRPDDDLQALVGELNARINAGTEPLSPES